MPRDRQPLSGPRPLTQSARLSCPPKIQASVRACRPLWSAPAGHRSYRAQPRRLGGTHVLPPNIASRGPKRGHPDESVTHGLTVPLRRWHQTIRPLRPGSAHVTLAQHWYDDMGTQGPSPEWGGPVGRAQLREVTRGAQGPRASRGRQPPWPLGVLCPERRRQTSTAPW